MGRLFNDGFTGYCISHCGVLVVSIVSSILGVCVMILKKTYKDNTWVTFKLIDITYDMCWWLTGIVIDSTWGELQKGDRWDFQLDNMIEVINEEVI